MQSIETPRSPRTPRRDGWTLARRAQFLEHLAAGLDVKRACARLGLSREGAYRVRRRDAAFARAWDAALAERRAAETRAFLARCRKRYAGQCQTCQPRVNFPALKQPKALARRMSRNFPQGRCQVCQPRVNLARSEELPWSVRTLGPFAATWGSLTSSLRSGVLAENDPPDGFP